MTTLQADASAPPATLAPILDRIVAFYRRHRERATQRRRVRRQIAALSGLDSATLKDIGMARSEIYSVVTHRGRDGSRRARGR